MTKMLLVIDDNHDLCELIADAAEIFGWNCQTTTTPDAFFAALTPEVALILLDLMMPEMDGVELLGLLGERRCSTPIVVMSGVGKNTLENAETLARTLGLTIAGHLQKPFQLTQLEAVLEHVSQS